MTAPGDSLHRVRSLLALLKLQLETGGYSPAELVAALDEAIALVSEAELPSADPGEVSVGGWPPVAAVVVDDEPRIADALARRLAREGLITRAAYSLAELALPEHEHGEVVVLDLSAAATADARARSRVAMARPVVVTGASLTEAAPLLRELTPFAVVQKPFSSELLASLVRRRAAGTAVEG